jgi:hypothetical protein
MSNIEMQQREIRKIGEDKQQSKLNVFEKNFNGVTEEDD